MRRVLPIMLLLVGGTLWSAQKAPRIDHSREQTDFGAEGDFQRPAPIPVEALQSLRKSNGDDDLLRCAEQEGIPVAEIPARWFVASEIRLSRMSASGLVVRAEDACLGGAHIAQFWVLAKSSAGYLIVFRGRADGLVVLPTRTNGYRDLQLTIVTQAGAYIDYVDFRYSKGKYQESGNRLEHPN
jgi:hypothetical protein